MKLSVVIAAYNERENVIPLTERLRRTLDSLAVDWELLYVVEGTDGTREALEEIAREVPRLKVLYRAEPSGLGAAFRRGFAAARGKRTRGA
jgi:glycosyltransferase involved in cell wall biosynthesis